MPSPSSDFLILPSTPTDAASIQACGDAAFGPASFRAYMFPSSRAHLTSTSDLAAWRQKRFTRMLAAGDTLHFKCVPAADWGRVVGYASWNRPGHFRAEKGLAGNGGQGGEGEAKTMAESDVAAGAKPLALEDRGGEEREEELPACMDVQVYRECMAIMDAERKKIWGDDTNFWYLGGLAIDPEYQGRGIAKMLVGMGLEWADADGVPTYLEATPEAAGMYRRFGFEKVGEYGFFDGANTCEFQIRQPRPGAAASTGAVES